MYIISTSLHKILLIIILLHRYLIHCMFTFNHKNSSFADVGKFDPLQIQHSLQYQFLCNIQFTLILYFALSWAFSCIIMIL